MSYAVNPNCRCHLCITALRLTHDVPVESLRFARLGHERMVAFRAARAQKRGKR